MDFNSYITLCLLLRAVFAGINLALNKRVSYCDRINLSSLIVDGSRDVYKAEQISESCEVVSYIIIHLEVQHYIHYVVVFEGDGNSNEGLNYFSIILQSDDGEENICGEYPNPSIGPLSDTGMRVNCRVNIVPKVKIQSKTNQGFSIAEVEVYTLVSSVQHGVTSFYQGCFKSFQHNNSFEANAWPMCANMCLISINVLAALLENDTCLCGMNINEENRLPLERCVKICRGHLCAGNRAYPIYLVHVQLPHYLACYQQLHPFPHISSRLMTIGKCLKACKDKIWAAIMNGDDCFCFSNFTSLSKSTSFHCNIPCTGNNDEICGGDKYASVYSSKFFGVQMLEFLRCDGKIDKYGVCKGTCKANFIGSYCIEVEVKFCEDFNPCINRTNSECIPSESEFYTCQCIQGYVESSGICERNMCEPDPCLNRSNTQCIQMDKSYKCECKEGYIQLHDHCIEIYICELNPCSNRSNTECIAIGHSYRCECKEGFIQIQDHCIEKKVCEPDPCSNRSNMECLEISNSYRCECKEGFAQFRNNCIDIDECEYESCDNKSSTCVNLNGSYACLCNPNYIKISEFVCINNETIFSELELIFDPLLIVIISIIIVFLSLVTCYIAKMIPRSVSTSSIYSEPKDDT